VLMGRDGSAYRHLVESEEAAARASAP